MNLYEKTPMIYSYMRSGSHFFTDYFRQRTGFCFETSHKYNDDTERKGTIAIVRDPVEAIASTCAMIWSNNQEEHHEDLNNWSDYQVNLYLETLRTTKEKSSVIIDYENLCKNPEDHVSYISKLVDIPINNNGEYVSLLKDNPSDGFSVTSKSIPIYDEFVDYIKKYDLSEAYCLYNELKARSIFN